MPTGAPSTQDLYDVGLAALQGRNPILVVRPGDYTDSFLYGGAAMAAMVIGANASGFRGTLVLGGRGAGLTLTCHDRGVDRDEGDFSVGSVTLVRPSAGNAGTFPAGTRFATEPSAVDGSVQTFTLDADLPFLAGDLSKSATAKCTARGRAGNVDAASIARILDVPPFSSAFTVTNPLRFAGGNEPESDPDLQKRTTQYPLVLRRGTKDAIEFAAKLTPGVRRASVVVPAPNMVLVYVCDVDGNSNATLAAAAQAIIDGPPAWRGASDIVTVVAADLFSQNLQLQVALRAGANPNQVFPRISAAVAARLNRLNPGEAMEREIVSTAGENADRGSIVSVKVVAPAFDVVPTGSQAIRAGTITFV